MNPLKRTTRVTLARFRAWKSDIRDGRDMARRYDLLKRLTRFGGIRRRLRHSFPRVAIA